MAYVHTRHSDTRAQQRGYRPNDIEFVLEYGTETRRGFLLARRDVSWIERYDRDKLADAERLKNTLVATSGGVVKTVFRATPKQQSRLL